MSGKHGNITEKQGKTAGKGAKRGKGGERIGLFIGRFQPFHNAHLADVKKALKEVDILYIGIGSAGELRTEKNPFSFQERKRMVLAALKTEGVGAFKILGVSDFKTDDQWMAFIEKIMPRPDIVFMGNGDAEKLFRRYGYTVKRFPLVKGISATIVRSMMRDDKKWEGLVPKAVAQEIANGKLLRKVRKITQ